MSEFEKGLNRLRNLGGPSDPYGGDDYTLGLLTIAEGLAEVIELVRPLAEAQVGVVEEPRTDAEGRILPQLCNQPNGIGDGQYVYCWLAEGHAGGHQWERRSFL